MNKSKKITLIISIALVSIVLLIGVTSAVFNYSRSSGNRDLIVGDIWMKYTGNNQINVTDMMPTKINYVLNTSEEAVSKCVNYIYNTYGLKFYRFAYKESDDGSIGVSYNNFNDSSVLPIGELPTYTDLCKYELQDVFEENKLTVNDMNYFEENNILINTTNLPYFEFEISGKNTYTKKDIYYEIALNHGDSHETRTERIRDDLLRFKLVEVVGDEERILFTNRSYNSLMNKKIWVDTIEKEKNVEVNHKYKLYMWIANETMIGNTNSADYDMDTWNNLVFASIRVDVNGDFNEKELTYDDIYDSTDASCFTSGLFEEGKYILNPVMKEQEVEEVNELTACILYFSPYPLDEGSTAQSFCKGEGTFEGMTFQEKLDTGTFDERYLEKSNIIVANDDSYIVNPILQEQTVEEVNELTTCVSSFEGMPFDSGSDATSWCKGTGTISVITGQPINFNVYIDYTIEELGEEEFLNIGGNQMLSENIIILSKERGVAILDYDASCGSDVVIPETIEGYPVRIIGNEATEIDSYLTQINNSFNSKSNNLLFDTNKNQNNKIMPINDLPNGAFYDKGLTSVIIPTTVENIMTGAFSKNFLTNVEIPNSVKVISDGAFEFNKLRNVTLKNGIREIYNFAFGDNEDLKVVSIPSSVTKLICNAFDDNVRIDGYYINCTY